MNENEIYEAEVLENAESEMIVDEFECESESGGTAFKIFAALGIAAASVAGAVLIKTRDKRKAKRRAKLIEDMRDEGYTVFEPGVIPCKDEDECEEVLDETV